MVLKKMNKQRIWIFAACAVVFFISSLILAQNGNIYISPDETANAFFAKQFAETGSLQASSPINEYFDNAIRPRSVVSYEGKLLPGSFLGLPVLYGVIASIFGSSILAILTPLIVIATAWLFYRLMEVWFKKDVAFVSSLLFLFHPAIWYYSARGLMHNVLFVCLLVIALYFFFVEHRKNFFLGGLFIGLSIFVRTSEALWVLPATFIIALLFYKYWNRKNVTQAIIGLVLGVAIILFFNQVTFNGIFNSGYTIEDSVASTTEELVDQSSSLFPFGLHPRIAKQHFRNYGFVLFWWLSLLALVGVSVFLQQKEKKKRVHRWLFFLIGTAACVWLVLFYGSWVFFDNPDPTQITIANSYVRYWLPLYIFSIPFIAYALVWISQQAQRKTFHTPVLIAILAAVFCLNVFATFSAGQDGLIRVSKTLQASKEIRNEILAQTPNDSIIIVDRSDKLFFPYRNVLYPLRSDQTYSLMPAIVESHSLYYYGITFPDEDLEYLNQRKLKKLGLQIKKEKTFDKESLYKLFKK